MSIKRTETEIIVGRTAATIKRGMPCGKIYGNSSFTTQSLTPKRKEYSVGV